MSTPEHTAIAKEVQPLMDTLLGLSEFTRFPGHCEEIPRFLQRVLGGRAVSMAIVRHPNEFVDAHIVHCSDSSSTSPSDGTLEKEMLERYRTTTPIWDSGFSDDGGEKSNNSLLSEITLASEERITRGIVLNHAIDDAHRILLIVWQAADQPPLPQSARDNLSLIVHVLSRQIVPVVAWQALASMLGEPFNQLTQKEWFVVRGLYSDICEKQLAVRLEMRQHTLHSHIKSIYRKLHVQGRLHLLWRLDSDMRRVRARMSEKPLHTAAFVDPAPVLV